MDLYRYSLMVINELDKRGIKHNNSKMLDYFNKWFVKTSDGEIVSAILGDTPVFVRHHDDSYLRQCFYNLQEKFERGQKDFTFDIYIDLFNFVSSQIELPDKIYQHNGKYDLEFIELLSKK